MDSPNIEEAAPSPEVPSVDIEPLLLERFTQWVRTRKWLGPAIVLFFSLAALKTFVIDPLQWGWEAIRNQRTPKLQLRIVTDDVNSDDAVVNATWQSTHFSGFSEPLPLMLAVKNVSSVPASNVDVHIVINEAAMFFGRGEPLPRAFIPSSLGRHEGQRILQFNIARVEPTEVPTKLSAVQDIRLRLRAFIATVFVQNDVVYVDRGLVDFKQGAVDEAGHFQLQYWITCKEQPDQQHGTLRFRLRKDAMLDFEKARTEQRFLAAKEQTQVLLDLGDIASRKSRKLKAVDLDSPKPLEQSLLPMTVEEIEATSGRWIVITVSGRGQYAEVDVQNDGLVDSFFYRPIAVAHMEYSEDNWFELNTSAMFDFLPIDFFFDATHEKIKQLSEAVLTSKPPLAKEKYDN